MNRKLLTKVAGVTYEGRQEHIARMSAGLPVQLKPEPDNPYDPNAIAVYVGIDWEDVPKAGYIPREFAAILAPLCEGEAVIGRVVEVTGGFEKWDGSRATYGLLVEFSIPDEQWQNGSGQ